MRALLFLLICTAAAAQTFPLTRTDALGRKVTLPAPPRRIVTLAPSNTELIFALGLGDRCVGVTNYCDYPPEVKNIARVGGYANMSVEQIAALSPDLVLAVYGNPDWMLARLRELSIPVFGLNPQRLADVPRDIVLVAELCGVATAGQELAAAFNAAIAAVTTAVAAATTRPRVYFGAWDPPFFSPGPGSFIYDMVELAGGENLTRGYGKNWISLSLEEIVERDPEIVIHGLEGIPTTAEQDNAEALAMLRRRAGWRATTAVRTGRVYLLNDNLLQRPGPRLAEGLRALARAIHPECFPTPP
ncbi:ABC transporter substrate-binding protein [bacterium]|nr:ABC transporter substrate-binding protein [bacterium]